MAPSSVVMPAAVVVATGMRAEDEAGEEDDGDDEDATRHDANPGNRCGEATMAMPLGDGFGSGQRTGCRFRRRRCFTHETDDASGADVPALNSI